MLQRQHQNRPLFLRAVFDGVDEEFDADQENWTADLIHRVLEGNSLQEIPIDDWSSSRRRDKPAKLPPALALEPRVPIEYDLKDVEQLAQYIAKFPHVPSVDQGMEIAREIAAAAVKYQWPTLDRDYVRIFSLEWMGKARA